MWGHPATKLSRAENRTRIKNALKAFHRFSFSVTTDYVLLTPRVFVWWANGPRQNDVARFLEEFRSETCEPVTTRVQLCRTCDRWKSCSEPTDSFICDECRAQ